MPYHQYGTTLGHDQKETGERRKNWSENIWIKVIDGDRADVLAKHDSYPIGASGSLVGCPLPLSVIVDCHYKPGGDRGPTYATLTIICANAPNVVYEELDVGVISRKIEYNPRYRVSYPLTAETLYQIEFAVNAPDLSAYNTAVAHHLIASNAVAQELLLKRMNGQDSYFEPAPIARRTTFLSLVIGAGTQLGQRQTPIFTGPIAIPTGYEWLKTADRPVTRPGFVERIEEWTGARDWDNDLYP